MSEYTATDRTPIARSVRMTRTAISPRLAISTVSNTRQSSKDAELLTSHFQAGPMAGVRVVMACGSGRPSHSEDPERWVGQGCVRCGGQRKAQHSTGIRGVDDAVVPQPGGGVVRVALVFVLRPDAVLEVLVRLWIVRRPNGR